MFFNRKIILLTVLFFLSILPFVWELPRKIIHKKVINERYEPTLYKINTLQKAERFIDSMYYANNSGLKFDTALYVQVASNFTKERFYHGISHYTISDNWIAYLGGRFLWSHVSAIVDPKDILKHSEGLCSQQTILFMELLRARGINVRTVGLGYKEGPGHFLCEVHYNNEWRLHDVTMEPSWIKANNLHKSLKFYLSNKDSLYIVYEGKMSRPTFDKILSNFSYGKTNEFPAQNMLLFHIFTRYITYLLPFIFLFFLVRNVYSKRKHV